MQVIDDYTPGEMLVMTEYNCEGIEEPWGFPPAILDDLPKLPAVSGSTFRRRTQLSRKKLARGDIAIVLDRMHVKHPAIDAFYVVLVRGQKLCVYPRFLARSSV